MTKSLPHPTRSQWLLDGSNPAAGFCRICGRFAVHDYPGWWDTGVCDATCFDEYQWRATLHLQRQPYRRPEV